MGPLPYGCVGGLLEPLTGVGMPSDAARQPLPTIDADIDEDRIELDYAGAAAGPFSGNQSGARPAERIQDYAATVAAVEYRVGDHGDRLDSGMQAKLALRGAVQGILADVMPDVGSMLPIPAKRYVVDVCSPTDLEHEDEFMLRAIEGPHPCVALAPDA